MNEWMNEKVLSGEESWNFRKFHELFQNFQRHVSKIFIETDNLRYIMSEL